MIRTGSGGVRGGRGSVRIGKARGAGVERERGGEESNESW